MYAYISPDTHSQNVSEDRQGEGRSLNNALDDVGH